MNTIYLSTAALLLPAAAVLLSRTLYRGYPWHLCTSAADWLILPVVALYVLIILTGGWLARCAELWKTRPERDLAPRRTSPRNLPARITTSAS